MRKKKNSAPLPGHGKKAILPSIVSPLPTSMSLSQPPMRDDVNTSRPHNILGAQFALGSCTILPSSAPVTTSHSNTAANDGLSMSQSVDTQSTVPRQIISNTKGKQKVIPASQPTNGGCSNLPHTSTNVCGSCCVDIPGDQRDFIALHCCLCDRYFHGVCSNIDESAMEYIHIISNTGGWCCSICRISKRNNNKSLTQTQKNAENIDSIKQELSRINDQLKHLTTSLSSLSPPASIINQINGEADRSTQESLSSSIKANSKSYSQALLAPQPPQAKQSHPPKLEKQFQTAVLTAVHAELNSISKRSFDIVVTGLPPNSSTSDTDQFVEICFASLDITPSVKSTHRLGDKKPNKIQPLLVTLTTTKEVDEILKIAKLLRKAPSEFVRDNIYFNKHLTKAEALNAYNDRMKRRSSKRGSNAAADIDLLSSGGSSTSISISPPVSGSDPVNRQTNSMPSSGNGAAADAGKKGNNDPMDSATDTSSSA